MKKYKISLALVVLTPFALIKSMSSAVEAQEAQMQNLARRSHVAFKPGAAPVVPLYRIQDTQIQALRKQITLDEKRSQILRPLIAGGLALGTIATVGGSLWYLTNTLFRSPTTHVVPNENEPWTAEQRTLITDHLRTAQEHAKLPFWHRAWKTFVSAAPTVTGQTIASLVLGAFAKKTYDITTSGVPSRIDRATDYILGAHDFEWYKANRTTFAVNVKNLRNYLKTYQNPYFRSDYVRVILSRFNELAAHADELNADEQIELERLQTEIEAIRQAQEQVVQEQPKPQEQLRRISMVTSLVIKQIEKLLGYVAHMQDSINSLSISLMEKIEMDAQVKHTTQEINRLVINMTNLIEHEVKQGKTEATLKCLADVEVVLDDIAREFEMFSINVDKRIYA